MTVAFLGCLMVTVSEALVSPPPPQAVIVTAIAAMQNDFSSCRALNIESMDQLFGEEYTVSGAKISGAMRFR